MAVSDNPVEYKTRSEHPLWSEDEAIFELARVGAILLAFQKAKRDPLSGFAKKIGEYAQAKGYAIEVGRSLRDRVDRLISFAHITENVSVLDAIADYVLQELTKIRRESDDTKYFQHIFSRIDLGTAFEDYKAHKLGLPVREHYRIGLMPSNALTSSRFEIAVEQYEDASQYLTGAPRIGDADREIKSAHYACYRYSVSVGSIVKSEFIFIPCSDNDPVFRFKNKVKEPGGAWRNSNGIGFRVGDWIYLIGQLEGESALKAVVVRAIGRTPPTLTQALVISKSLKPFVGRAVLERLKVPMPENEIRVADERTDAEFSSRRFQEIFVPQMRNNMEFRLERELIFKQKGKRAKVFTQAQLVQFLPSLIDGAFYLRGLDGELEPFNPASHHHYPFNQAITFEGN